jgi:uncharacterized membrane protein
MNWEQTFATGHLVAAISALIVGVVVLLSPKGTRTHRKIGTIYVLVLVLANSAALSLHRESSFGVFHVLAVASLVSMAAGLLPLLLGNRSQAAIANHAYFMTWSYAGLVAAGCGQLSVAVGQDAPGWVVPLVIATVLIISGVIIFGKVPSILDRMFSGRLGSQIPPIKKGEAASGASPLSH